MRISKKIQKRVLKGKEKSIDKVLFIAEPEIRIMTKKALTQNKMDKAYQDLFEALIRIELERSLYEDFPRFYETYK